MKNTFTIGILSVLLSSFSVMYGITDVINAIKAGNAAELSKYYDNNIEITMPDKSNSYSKSQAALVIQDFFSINGVKGFEIIHKGSNAGSEYCIGTLVTKNGNFRTTIFMKQRGDIQVLQELRFEKR